MNQCESVIETGSVVETPSTWAPPGFQTLNPVACQQDGMEFVTQGGEDIPAIGIGTGQMKTGTAYRAVSTGLNLGYRHADTTQLYGNEGGVRRASAESDVDRKDVFLTTKVNP